VEIVVLLKQVPATESIIAVAGDGKSIKTDDLKWVISPYDEFAVEEALRIRDAQGGKVTILTVGPDKATEAVRTALAMGADEGVLINDAAAQECDSLGVAKVLAAALKQMPYDLIIAGQRAVDVDNYTVGTAVAEYLGIPNISMVNQEEIADGKIKCRQTIEGGTVTLEADLPVLFTTQRGLNEPRYASLPGIMKAKKKPLATKSLADLGLDAADLQPAVTIAALQPPPERKGGRIIEGETAAEKAAELVKLLNAEAKVL
jgi:electron transfer flavoprotein beta subunit